jgi:ribosomal protein S18 acetylase RimI-like enzyme
VTSVAGATYTHRVATEDDAPFLYELFASTRTDLDRLDWSDESRAAFCDLQWRAKQAGHAGAFPDARDEILEQDGAPVGRLLVAVDASDLVLVDVALVPPCRGRGLGREVIAALQREAAASGRGVRLHVESGNPARRLYERLGFVARERSGLHTEMRWHE